MLVTPEPGRRKLASEWLIKFYQANPQKLEKLMRNLVKHAESGKTVKYLEIVINLLEGPAKESGTGDTYNFNFISEGERLRAQDSVRRIMAMREKTILLPEKKDERSPEPDAGPAGA